MGTILFIIGIVIFLVMGIVGVVLVATSDNIIAKVITVIILIIIAIA